MYQLHPETGMTLMEREDGHVVKVYIDRYIILLSCQCNVVTMRFMYVYRGLVIAQEMVVLRISSSNDMLRL